MIPPGQKCSPTKFHLPNSSRRLALVSRGSSPWDFGPTQQPSPFRCCLPGRAACQQCLLLFNWQNGKSGSKISVSALPSHPYFHPKAMAATKLA